MVCPGGLLGCLVGCFGQARRAICSVALLLATSAAWPAGDALLLERLQSAADGWPHARVLEEEGGRVLDIEQARAARAAFKPPAAVHGNLGPRAHAVWLRLPLRVAADDAAAWWLDLGFAGVDRADLYLYEDGRQVQQVRVRNDQPFADKILPTRSQVVPLQVRPGGDHELLIRFESSTTLLVPLRFVRPAEHGRAESRLQALQGLISGVWLCLLVYALVQWLAVRERVFLAFAVSSAAASLFFLAYFGHGPQHLWGNNPWLEKYLWAPSVLTMIGANALFVHDALGVAGFHPRLAIALRAVVLAAAAAVAAFLTGAADLAAAALMAKLLGPLPMLLGIAAALFSLRRGDRAAPLVLSGWVAVLAGTVAMVCLQQGWLPLNFWFDHALQLAMTFEIVLWMLVLAMRVKDVQAHAAASRRENQRLHALAFSDPLTGLLNRRGLYLALEQSLPAALPSSAVAVYLLDLDEFKPVNDRFGHDVGDGLLIEVGRRLKSQLRELDLVARLGGDEFVVVIHKVADGAAAQDIGTRLWGAVTQPFNVAGSTARLGATVGYSLAPHDGCDIPGLLKHADSAMYEGKQTGRNRVLRGACVKAAADGERSHEPPPCAQAP